MLRLLSFITTCILILLLLPCAIQIKIDDNKPTFEALNWADVTATRLVSCLYDNSTGLWRNEAPWQSGNTLESLANFISLRHSPLKYVFDQTYLKTDIFVGGECYDDYQWWLLAWMQIYQVEPDVKYLRRAADIYETVATKAWNTSQCNGGVQWCPTNAYKNAITNELFLLSSMRLHPYATLLGKSSTYYLRWALKEWQWLENSGMMNSDYLINEGLGSIDNTCVNDNQTTWTSNQGVILTGLALLYDATQNSTLLDIADKIADASIRHLIYPNGILKEPCEDGCTDDQKLFKGIFVRHLGYLLPYFTDKPHKQKYSSFLQKNAMSVLTVDRCDYDGLFGVFWTNYTYNSCGSPTKTITTSAVLDLFISMAKTQQQTPISPRWMLLGQGSCVDEQDTFMPSFYRGLVDETTCRDAANEDAGAVAYDYELKCNRDAVCHIRTLSDPTKTPPGFEYKDGTARNVTRTTQTMLTDCYLKIN